MLRLRLGQLAGLLPIGHPRPTPGGTHGAAQAGVPHRPARTGDPLRELLLLAGELHPKLPARQHDSTILLRST